MLSESGKEMLSLGTCVIFFPSRQEGQSETKAMIGKGAVTQVSPERGLFGHFYLDSVLVFVILQTCLRQWFCFLSCPIQEEGRQRVVLSDTDVL